MILPLLGREPRRGRMSSCIHDVVVASKNLVSRRSPQKNLFSFAAELKLLRVRIRAEDFDEVAVYAQKLDGLDDLASCTWPSQSMKKKYSHAFRLLGRDSIFVMLIL